MYVRTKHLTFKELAIRKVTDVFQPSRFNFTHSITHTQINAREFSFSLLSFHMQSFPVNRYIFYTWLNTELNTARYFVLVLRILYLLNSHFVNT